MAKEKKKTDEPEDKEERKYFTFHAEGPTPQAAEADLTAKLAEYREEYGLKLDQRPEETVYQVLIFKGETPGRTNLQGMGASYEEAMQGIAEEFEIDVSKFNQLVQIVTSYPLTDEDARAAAKVPPPSAVETESRTDTLEYLM